MITIETKKIKISEELKKKIEILGRFTNSKPLIILGNLINIKGTNVAYVEPHKVIIKNTSFFFFEECEDIFINNLYTKIKRKDLETYIKNNSNL